MALLQSLPTDQHDMFEASPSWVQGRQGLFDAEEFRSEHATALIRHWLEITGDRLLPYKKDLRPEQLKAALPNVIIYEYVDQDTIRFHLAGTATRAAYQRDLTGLNYLDFVPPEMRDQVSWRMHHLVQQPCALKTTLIGPAGKQTKGLFEIIGLPLLDADGAARFSVHTVEMIESESTLAGGDVKYLSNASAIFLDIGAGTPDCSDRAEKTRNI